MLLADKHVLITGGASGIGLALAQQLLAKGSRVTICARGQESLNEASTQLNSSDLTAIACDISDYGQIQSMLKSIPPVDILINNAAIWLEGELETNTPDQIFHTVHINLVGLIFATQAVLVGMKKRDEGTIVNVSSSVGLEGREKISVYAATKFGVRGFTDSLKKELAATNLNVIGFYPCGTKTSLYSRAQSPKPDEIYQSYIKPEEMAETLVFALEKQDALILDHLVVNRRKKQAR